MVVASMKAREVDDVDLNTVLDLYEKIRVEETKVNDLKRQRNTLGDSGKIAEAKAIKESLRQHEANVVEMETQLLDEAVKIPNDLHPAVPMTEATILHWRGEKPSFSFTPLTHLELAKHWDLLDIESGSTVAHSGFYFAKNELVLLELALINWVTQKMAARQFRPVMTPDVAQAQFAEACGFRPRSDASQTYKIANSDLCLIGTSEIPLAGMYFDKLYYHKDEPHFPLKSVGISHCFRAETSHGGQMTKGIYRVHQFSKVELFIVALPTQSESVHQDILDIQMEIFSELGLHYKVLDMPANDLGASAYRKFDIEAWFPSHDNYGEISSTSNCTDFQSRRLGLRIKDEDGRSHYLHTLNGTALAVPRIMMAILENFQQEDKTVRVPSVLVPFMGGLEIIGGHFQNKNQLKHNQE